jgi:hypothetical protein
MKQTLEASNTQRRKNMNSPKRPIPLRLQQNIAVQSRLSPNHQLRPVLEKDAAKRWAGYLGERDVDYYLEFLEEDKYIILKDLRLINRHGFQIDTLLLTPRMIVILEIKNISGTVFFHKQSNQMFRITKDMKEGFSNPIFQAKMHRFQLQNWMKQRKSPLMPIEYLVVFSNPSTMIETDRGNEQIFQNVLHANFLLEKISELESKYPDTALTKKTLQKLNQLLIAGHSPYLIDILTKYGILLSDIKPGVRCPECNFIPMMRISANWHCPNCKVISKSAHIHAVYDYLLLNNPAITNQQARDFLQISSRRVARAALSHLPLIGSGSTSSYELSQQLLDSAAYFLNPKKTLFLKRGTSNEKMANSDHHPNYTAY